MRITDAWNSLSQQNTVLKFALFITSLVALLMALMAYIFSQDTPLVIERGDTLKFPTVKDSSLTSSEIEQFVREALAMRFNTDANDFPFLSDLQKGARAKEQSELARNKMRQFIYIESVSEGKSDITVEATRLILVGEIRSGFRFPLKLKLLRCNRSRTNPYGLILAEVETVKPEQRADHVPSKE